MMVVEIGAGTYYGSMALVADGWHMSTHASALLISASDSAAGGIRGLWQLRIPLEGLGVVVYPDMFWLPHALSAFDSSGALKDPKLAERLGGVVRGYLEMAGKLSKPKA